MRHPLTTSELEAGLDHVLESPRDQGTVDMIVIRPGVDQRRVLESGELDPVEGLLGDRWGSGAHDDDRPREIQLTLMNSRFIDLIAGSRERWQLAGDQLYVDLDLSVDNLPPGSRLEVGLALLEVTEQPHTGCSKFSARFGPEALRFANVGRGPEHRLRGMYARVVEAGRVTTGDAIRKRPTGAVETAP